MWDSRKTKFIYVFLALLGLGYIIYTFSFEKEGLHSDEIWSYGLSNSYYNPHIFFEKDIDDNLHKNEWITGDDFHNYITVQSGERYAYSSVIYNLKRDTHPPLYFMLLHTISSTFPDTYSRWYGFVINIFSFILVAVFLYKLVYLLSGQGSKAILVFLMYSFSLGGLSTFIFIRQYALLVAISLATVFYFTRIIKCPEEKIKGNIIKYVICIGLGCLTHFCFMVIAFISGLVTLIWLIKNKRKKDIMLLLVIGIVAVIPFLVSTNVVSNVLGSVFSSGAADATNEAIQSSSISLEPNWLRGIKLVMSDFFGIKLKTDYGYYIKTILATLVFALIVCLPISYFVLRHNWEKVQKAVNSNKIALKQFRFGKKNLLYFSMLLMIVGVLLFAAKFSKMNQMGPHGSRYLFVVYPLIALIIVNIIVFLAELIAKVIAIIVNTITGKNGKAGGGVIFAVSLMLVAGLLISVNIKEKSAFLFERNNEGICFENLVEDKNVALFVSEHWLMTCYADLLQDAEEVFIGNSGDMEELKASLSTDLSRCDYIVLDATTIAEKGLMYLDYGNNVLDRDKIEERCLPIIEKSIGNKALEFVAEDEIFTRKIYIYRVEEINENSISEDKR